MTMTSVVALTLGFRAPRLGPVHVYVYAFNDKTRPVLKDSQRQRNDDDNDNEQHQTIHEILACTVGSDVEVVCSYFLMFYLLHACTTHNTVLLAPDYMHESRLGRTNRLIWRTDALPSPESARLIYLLTHYTHLRGLSSTSASAEERGMAWMLLVL